MSEPRTITLPQPILDEDGNRITALVLREPTLKDIREIGLPFVITEGVPQPDDGRMIKMAARLSGLPPPVLNRISANCYFQIVGEMMAFFTPSSLQPPVGGNPETTRS